MYWVTAAFFSSAFILSRELKKSLTGGWVNKYADVAALTPVAMPATSAAVQFGTGCAGAGIATAVRAAPTPRVAARRHRAKKERTEGS